MAGEAKRRCSATNKRGEACGARAITPDGRCAIHGGVVDPSELGRKGGRASVRSRLGLGPEVADDDLREKARARLNSMLDSDDEKTQLSSAKSLYSYGATPAPSDRRPTGGTPASIEHDYAAIREKLEECGVLAYRPGSPAESERIVELRAQVKTLRDENATLREMVAVLEGRSE
jgi:hypothetical protein